MGDLKHTINIAATRSGLSAHVIRVWEKRYTGIKPSRTSSNRRLYSESDIEKLRLLKQATDLGCRIAHVAHLEVSELASLIARVHQDQSPEGSQPQAMEGQASSQISSADQAIDQILQAILLLEQERIEQLLEKSMVEFGHQGMLCQVLAPLTRRMGEAWAAGRLTIPQEHAASATIKSFLFSRLRSFGNAAAAPRLLVATPSDQHHEIGAIMVASLAANLGWKPVYIGASVPAQEIASAAMQQSVHALALSLVYPHGDEQVIVDLESLRKALPDSIPILVGGQALSSYRQILGQIGAICCQSLGELQQSLRTLQSTVLGRKRLP